MPELTVIVCTHERPESLRGCLAALAALEDPVEVIVVDSASQPPCRELVESHGFALPLRARARAFAGAERGARGCADRARRVRRRRRRRRPGLGARGSRRRSPTRRSAASAAPASRASSARGPAGSRSACSSTRESRASTRRASRARRASTRSARTWPSAAKRSRASRSASAGSAPSLLSGEEAAAIDRLREDGWRVRLEPAAVVRHAVSPERLRSGYYWRRLWWQGRSRARGERSLRLTVQDRRRPAGPARALRGDPRPRPPVPDRRDAGLPARARGAMRRWGLVFGVGARRPRAPAARRAALPGRLPVPADGARDRRARPADRAARARRRHVDPERGGGAEAALPAARRGRCTCSGRRSRPRRALVALVASAAVVTLAAALADRLGGSWIAAAALCLASPAIVFWSGFSGPDALAQALALGAALAVLSNRERLGGVLWGLGVVARPEVVLLALALPFVRRRRVEALACGLFAIAAVLLIVRPPIAIPAGGGIGHGGRDRAAAPLRLAAAPARGARPAQSPLARARPPAARRLSSPRTASRRAT